MKLNKISAVCGVYNHEGTHRYLERVQVPTEDLESFKRTKEGVTVYVGRCTEDIPDVPSDTEVAVLLVRIHLTIYKPPCPDLEEIQVIIDRTGTYPYEPCRVEDQQGRSVMILSNTFDVTWRDLNRIVDHIIKITA